MADRTIVLAGVGVYLVILVMIGLYFKNKAAESSTNYWMAERNVGPIVSAVALIAAYASGFTYIGVPGLGYKYGILAQQFSGLSANLGMFLGAFLIAKPLRRFGKFTLTDYLSERYESKFMGWLTPFFIIIFYVPYIVVQLAGGGIIASEALGVSYQGAVVAMSACYIIYVVIGGMMAVTAANFIQGILMMVFMWVPAIGALVYFGGFSKMFTLAKVANPYIGGTSLGTLSLAGMVVTWTFFSLGVPVVIARVFASRDERTAELSLAGGPLCNSIMYIGGIFIPIAALAMFPNLANPDTAYIRVVMQIFPPAIVGLCVCGVLAALMSTTDANLLQIGTAVSNDIYKKHINPKADDKKLIRVSIIAQLVAGIAAMILAFSPPEAIGILGGLVGGVIGSTFAFPVLLGLWWKRATRLGAIVSMIGGFTSFVLLKYVFQVPPFAETIIAVPIALVLMIVVSVLSPRDISEETIQRTCTDLHAA